MLTSEELKSSGNKHFAAKNYREAIDFYTKAIELQNDDAVLFSNRAMSYLKLLDWNKALQDCDDGLGLVKDDKVKVKLLFRKACSFKGMNSSKLAKQYFQKVLELDPDNQVARSEFASLEDTDDMKGVKSSNNTEKVEIPVEQVERLPEEFELMLNDDGSVKLPELNQPKSVLEQENNELLDKEINELFGNKKTKKVETTSTPLTDNFNQRSTTSILSTLKNIPGANKANAYNFVINIPPLELADDFSFGIEPEFLSFFFESAAYVSSNDSVEHWPLKVLETLKTLSKVKRYSIAKTFCEETPINILVGNVSKKSPHLLDNYKELIN